MRKKRLSEWNPNPNPKNPMRDTEIRYARGWKRAFCFKKRCIDLFHVQSKKCVRWRSTLETYAGSLCKCELTFAILASPATTAARHTHIVPQRKWLWSTIMFRCVQRASEQSCTWKLPLWCCRFVKRWQDMQCCWSFSFTCHIQGENRLFASTKYFVGGSFSNIRPNIAVHFQELRERKRHSGLIL